VQGLDAPLIVLDDRNEKSKGAVFFLKCTAEHTQDRNELPVLMYGQGALGRHSKRDRRQHVVELDKSGAGLAACTLNHRPARLLTLDPALLMMLEYSMSRSSLSVVCSDRSNKQVNLPSASRADDLSAAAAYYAVTYISFICRLSGLVFCLLHPKLLCSCLESPWKLLQPAELVRQKNLNLGLGVWHRIFESVA
jgi:hypothetical protein